MTHPMKKHYRFVLPLCLLILLGSSLSISTSAFAVGSAGFENASLDTKALGRGNAFTAGADNPSAVSYNPAAMSELDNFEVAGGASAINLRTHYEAAPGDVNTKSANKFKYAPNLYVAAKVPYLPVHLGFGINSPFGLATEYSSTHPFRYVGHKNELIMLAYTMSGSIKLCPQLSIGGGATYYDADLKQRAKINSTLVTQTVIPGFPAVEDAPLRLKAGGNGWGWNLGVLWKPRPKHKFGFNFRSAARLAFKGHVFVEDIQGPVMQAIFGGSTGGSPINTDIVLPAQATIGYQYQITPKWDVETDFAWTGWHTFDRQEFTLGNPNAVLSGLTPIAQGYHDTFSFSVGSDYDLTKHIAVRGGYFFFQSPLRDGHMGPVIPDADRHGFAVGLGLNFKHVVFDLAYIAELFAERTAKHTSVGQNAGIVADGNYSTFVNLISFNATYRFGEGGK